MGASIVERGHIMRIAFHCQDNNNAAVVVLVCNMKLCFQNLCVAFIVIGINEMLCCCCKREREREGGGEVSMYTYIYGSVAGLNLKKTSFSDRLTTVAACFSFQHLLSFPFVTVSQIR